MSSFRLIVDPPAPGAWNMGVDEALLEDAPVNGLATLRFYQWSEPTLSLGYFQRYEDRQQHPPSLDCPVVRRQTGGGAILHDRELTYSLALPETDPLAKNSRQLYQAVHDAVIAVLTPLIEAHNSTWVLRRREDDCSSPARDEPFLCFQRRACGDVILERQREVPDAAQPDADLTVPSLSFKILGSAQRRHRGAILQHGSLLLERSPYAPELVGWRDLTGTEPPISDLVNGVNAKLRRAPIPGSVSTSLSPASESKAAELAKKKYGSVAWTKRR